MAAARRRAAVESELPFVLREFSVYLDIGMPFERALAKVAGRKYVLSPELSAAQGQIRSGASVQNALYSSCMHSRSLALRRSMMLLSSVYETGATAESLRRAAEDLSASQVASLRLQAGKLSLVAVAFVATSALLPALFSVFSAVSPLLLSSSFSQSDTWLFFLIVFPALNCMSLAALFLMLPPASRARQDSPVLDSYLSRRGFSRGPIAFAAASALVALSLASLLFFLGQPLAALVCLCLAPAAYSLAQRAASLELKQAEESLPDALYQAASIHRILSAEKMLQSLSQSGFGRLSEAFEIAARRQKAGEGFQKSLEAAGNHCPSPLVARALSLLSVAYETGANLSFALRETAQDTAAFFALVRERAALLSVQRYTVLAASALLVPFVLGTAVSLSPSLSSASSLFQSGPSAALPLASAAQAYLLINSALSALMLSLSESDARRWLLYFSAIAPVSQLAFALASAGALSFFAA